MIIGVCATSMHKTVGILPSISVDGLWVKSMALVSILTHPLELVYLNPNFAGYQHILGSHLQDPSIKKIKDNNHSSSGHVKLFFLKGMGEE